MMVDRCDGCGYYHSKSNLPLYINDNNDILVIINHPTEMEVSEDGPLKGAVYTPLLRYLKPLAHRCAFIHAYGCNLAGEKITTDLKKRCGMDRVRSAIAYAKPKYVLCVGKEAFNATGLKGERGKLIEKDGITYMHTSHPAVVFSRPAEETVIRSDLEHFYRVVTGKTRTPPVFEWELNAPPMTLIEKATHVAYDLETTGLDPETDKVIMVGLRFRFEDKSWSKVYVVPIDHINMTEMLPSVRNRYLAGVKAALEKEGIISIGHNVCCFDNKFLRKLGINPKTSYDTLGASYLLDENLPHSLKWEARTRYSAPDYAVETETFTLDCNLKKVGEYCALDVFYTSLLFEDTCKELLEDKQLFRIFHKILMPSARTLENVYERGIRIDFDRLVEVDNELQERAFELTDKMNALVGNFVLWSSPKQVADVLFRQFRMPILSKTDTGQPSTGEDALLHLAERYDKDGRAYQLLTNLIEYRKTIKLRQSFTRPWIDKLVTTEDYRLHPSYKPFRTVTGRLACENPNLQQVPRDGLIRNLVVARPGWYLVEADYSQLELRIAAFQAQEPAMLEIYRTGGDIHTETAKQISGRSEITKEDRTHAKAVNFGFLYGMGWKKFKEYAFTTYGVKVTDEQAKMMRQRFFEKYSALPKWHDRQRREVREHEQVRTPLGRIRRLPGISSVEDGKRAEAERMAINSPVQSMGSDLCLLAMSRLEELLPADKAVIVGQVHDAILFEVKEDAITEILPIIKNTMQDTGIIERVFGVKLNVPIVADVKYGPCWGKGKEWK